jgi:diguanylate cyclase
MSANDTPDKGARPRGWRKWLGLASRADADPADPTPALHREPTQREIWLPAKRRLLAQVADFLIDHDLEVLPFTLAIAYDCVTGGSPHLAQKILERAERGLPITLKWLEDVGAIQPRDATTEAMTTLVGQIEDGLGEFGRTMAGTRMITGTFVSALESHVAEMDQAGDASRLATLTRGMVEHARTVQRDLAASEAMIAQLQARLDESRILANQDHLTGLPNRRAFDALFDRELREARLSNQGLCVAFCDIDHFRRINDTHGHPAGDRILRHVAETLARVAQAQSHVARHGGEEFAVVLRGVSLGEAWARLDAAREDLSRKRLVNRASGQPFGQITFSGGIADAMAYRTRSAALTAADEALRAAKHAGRNRVMIAGQREPEPLRDAA